MWRVYAGHGEGIPIQSTFDRLTKCFLDEDGRLKGEAVHVGLIKYIDFRKDEIPDTNMFAPIIYKRKYFEHEREVRAVYGPWGWGNVDSQMLLAALSQGAHDGVSVRVDLQTLIENVYVAPTSRDWFYELVRSILPESLPLKFSRLDDRPHRPGRERMPRRRGEALSHQGAP